MVNAMPRVQLLGYALMAVGIAWLCFDQMLIVMTPVAMASEAPYRHLGPGDSFTRNDAFDLSYALARDIRDRLPNVLLPLGPLLGGLWLVIRSHARRGPIVTPRSDGTRTI